MTKISKDKFDSLLKELGLDLDKTFKDIAFDGLKIMNQSKDPTHDTNHVIRMLRDLPTLLKSIDSKNVNLNLLVCAITWHDTWKAKTKRSDVLSLFLADFLEGPMSFLMVKENLKGYNLNSHDIDLIAYMIRKHAYLQIFRSKTIEAQILKDLDVLDAFSELRAREFSRSHPALRSKFIRKRLLKYYDQLTPKFYFNWSKKEYIRRTKKLEKLFTTESI